MAQFGGHLPVMQDDGDDDGNGGSMLRELGPSVSTEREEEALKAMRMRLDKLRKQPDWCFLCSGRGSKLVGKENEKEDVHASFWSLIDGLRGSHEYKAMEVHRAYMHLRSRISIPSFEAGSPVFFPATDSAYDFPVEVIVKHLMGYHSATHGRIRDFHLLIVDDCERRIVQASSRSIEDDQTQNPNQAKVAMDAAKVGMAACARLLEMETRR